MGLVYSRMRLVYNGMGLVGVAYIRIGLRLLYTRMYIVTTWMGLVHISGWVNAIG